MMRFKTELEKNERYRDEAARLRGALFAASTADDLEEARRICVAAMRGELHGKEPKPFNFNEIPEWMSPNKNNSQ